MSPLQFFYIMFLRGYDYAPTFNSQQPIVTVDMSNELRARSVSAVSEIVSSRRVQAIHILSADLAGDAWGGVRRCVYL